MSYYSIDFAGISSGWYRKTVEENYAAGRRKIDKYWNSTCDLILIKFVEKYGTFFTAFYKDIIKEIDKTLHTDFENNVRYYEYYLATRACEINKTKRIWIDSYKNNRSVNYTSHFSIVTLKYFRL